MDRKDVGWQNADWLNLVPNSDQWWGITKTKKKCGLTWL